MRDLSLEFKSKLQKLFIEKNYSKLEKLIESLKGFDKLPINILMIYAVSKAHNPKSKINDYTKAAFCFEKIFNLNKSNLEPLYNLIIVSLKAKKFINLKKYLDQVYQDNKSDPKILEGLAKVNYFLSNMSNVTFFYKELIKVRPDFLDGWIKFLGTINYHQNERQEKYLEYCKEFDQLPTKKNVLKISKLKNKEKIILGFFSPDFKHHPVSYFLKDILKKIDKDKFNVIAYSNLPNSGKDSFSEELKNIFDTWIDISSMRDEEVIKMIITKKTDILINLAGYTMGNRINIFKSRSAPIQLSWIGYCNSLGIENMDYLIADKYLIKNGEEKLYTEKIIYMPKIWNALSKPKKLPNINNKIFDKASPFVFGSLNNFQKISDNTIKVWSRILNKSNSKLILKSSNNYSEDLKNNLLEKFSRENVNIKKVVVLDTIFNQNNHLECYNKFHLTLDTFPYPGVTTSFESLLMGKPVLTMEGNNFNSRCGESINRNLSLNDFIAKNEEEYVDKAVGFTKRMSELQKLNETLQKRTLASPLFDTDDFAKNLNSILFKIYKNH